MQNIWKYLNYIVLFFLIFLCFFGTFIRHITFGWGLGDLMGFAFLYFTTILHLILTIIFRNKTSKWHKFLGLFFLIVMISICLKVTIWRGSAYRWNGSLFYVPCRTEIEVKNKKDKRKIAVEMCTGNYESKLIGTWDGKFFYIKNAQTNLPPKLNQYIKFPIEYVGIESYVSDDSTIQHYEFKTDTLKFEKTYTFEGIIIRIENEIPIFKIRNLNQK